MESYAQYLVQPLCELGTHQVHVTGALKSIEGGRNAVTRIMARCFGHSFSEVRVQADLVGLNQVGSVMSSWDHFENWVAQRQ